MHRYTDFKYEAAAVTTLTKDAVYGSLDEILGGSGGESATADGREVFYHGAVRSHRGHAHGGHRASARADARDGWRRGQEGGRRDGGGRGTRGPDSSRGGGGPGDSPKGEGAPGGLEEGHRECQQGKGAAKRERTPRRKAKDGEAQAISSDEQGL